MAGDEVALPQFSPYYKIMLNLTYKGVVPSSQVCEPMRLNHYRTGIDFISLVRVLVRMGHLLTTTSVMRILLNKVPTDTLIHGKIKLNSNTCKLKAGPFLRALEFWGI